MPRCRMRWRRGASRTSSSGRSQGAEPLPINKPTVVLKLSGSDPATNAAILGALCFFLPVPLMAFAVTQANRWSADEEDGRLELVLYWVGRGALRAQGHRGLGLETLLEADAAGRGQVLAPAVDLGESGAAIKGDCRLLVDAGFEHEALHAHVLRRRFETRQHGLPDSPASLVRLHKHAFHLGGRGIEQADRATAHRALTIPRDAQLCPSLFEMLRLEVRPEAPLR